MNRRSLLHSLASFLLLTAAHADPAPALKLVEKADDDRIACMLKPDKAKLSAAFSDDLHYAHSNGLVDKKGEFIEKLTSGASKYLGYDHQERVVTQPSPGMALITGKARIQAESSKGKMDNALSYLAVWRKEKGQWRLLAWQSCKLPPAEK
jgi:hypothetical protein